MNDDAREFINGCLDETLTAEQHHTLGEWINEDAENARQFAAAAKQVQHEVADERLAEQRQHQREVQLQRAVQSQSEAFALFHELASQFGEMRDPPCLRRVGLPRSQLLAIPRELLGFIG